MRLFTTFLLLAATLLLATGDAHAQRWGRPSVPSRGVCFYEDTDYDGRYFCFPAGASIGVVPAGTNDEISSMRVFGSVEITVYKDGGFRGTSRRFTSNMRNLATAGWNDRISSFRVQERGGDEFGGGWGGAYGGGNPQGGGHHSGQGGGYGNGWGGAYGGGSHGGWGDDEDRGSRYTYQQAEAIVRRAYQSTLRRDPDPSARSWITEVMKQNLSQGQLEAELRKSDEYRNRPQ